MTTISIVTPWLDHIELIPAYEAAVAGAEVIIVDNGSTPEGEDEIQCMAMRLGGRCLRNETNTWFAAACNQGIARATGDIIICLNNDITAPSAEWLASVAADVEAGMLVGPTTEMKIVARQPFQYIEGWCVAARRETWAALGGWDADAYPLPYWEDVDLSWRAIQAGMRLRRTSWPLAHLGNTTSRHTPGAYSASDANRRTFEARARQAREVAA